MKEHPWDTSDMPELPLNEAIETCKILNDAWEKQGRTLPYNERHELFWDAW